MDTGLKIVNNFFEDPDSVRNHGISLRDYQPCDFFRRNGIYSGYRTQIQNKNIEQTIVSKLENLFQKKFATISMTYHLNTHTSMMGCPHKDTGASLIKESASSIAGVIYLSKNAPPGSGTTLYEAPDHIGIENFHDKMQIMYDVAIPPDNFFKRKFALEMKEYKENLMPIASSEHVYNTLIMYSADVLHAPGFYFGETVENARLTIPIHAKFAE